MAAEKAKECILSNSVNLSYVC